MRSIDLFELSVNTRQRALLFGTPTAATEIQYVFVLSKYRMPSINDRDQSATGFSALRFCFSAASLYVENNCQDDPKKNDPMYRAANAIAVEERTVNGTCTDRHV